MSVCKHGYSRVTMSMGEGGAGPVTLVVLRILAVLGSRPVGRGRWPCLLPLDRGTGVTSR